jgi:hypothetical protein
MKTFEEFCEERNFDLEAVVVEVSSGKRAAVRSHAYPASYGRAQYPKEYFRPIAADAAYYQDIEEKE